LISSNVTSAVSQNCPSSAPASPTLLWPRSIFSHRGGTALAWKRVLSWEVSEAMKKGRISKSEMAKRMGTSRSQLERLLDPENPHVLLETVQKAATAVGKRLTIGLTDAPGAA